MSTQLSERKTLSKTPSKSILDDLDLEYAGTEDLTRLAGRLIDQGEYAAAEDLIQQAMSMNPDNILCQAYLIICVASLGRNDEATTDMARKLKEEHPNDPAGWFALGHLELMAGRRGAAFTHFDYARGLARRDRRMLAAINRRDPRREPVIKALGRDHDLNILLGKIRSIFMRG